MKRLWVDIETSGLDESRHGIVQIAGMVEINNNIEEKFDYKVKLMTGDKITKASIKSHGYSIEQIRTFTPSQEIYKKLLKMFQKYIDPYDKKDKFHLVGYNAYFDYKFLRRFFEKNNFKWFGSYTWFPPTDIMQYANFYFEEQRYTFNNFKLRTVAEHLGKIIDEDSLHDFSYDIELTKFIYDTIRRLSNEKVDLKINIEISRFL